MGRDVSQQNPPVPGGGRCSNAWAMPGQGWGRSLLSHHEKDRPGRLWGCPQLSWPWKRAPLNKARGTPGACRPLKSLLPVIDSAPRQWRETGPAQGPRRRAGSQAGSRTENRLECLSHVPCSRQGGHPRAPQDYTASTESRQTLRHWQGC